MHLKSVTLRGFKSFAQTTTFAFEPGVTAIVGPNGSGKSNVADALAWVMGEQGAKSLRGGRMEDVIFAGTATRGPLGRAEVRVTIDNADGALPIEYSEVTIGRTLFRNGTSEYAINGESCRLLDVQELLSDSGLGSQMHVIVGQGRLDTVLQATPEDRRGFVEEAAGILKHRRRREKTVRKLDAMQANLTRLSDLAGEVRRQLTPLGRQAELARRAVSVAAVARDARARLLADEVSRLRIESADLAARERDLHAERMLLQDQARTVRMRIAGLAGEEVTAETESARGAVTALERVRERLTGLAGLAQQRVMLLGEQSDVAHRPRAVTEQMLEDAAAAAEAAAAAAEQSQESVARAQQTVARTRAELDAVEEHLSAQSALLSEHELRAASLQAAADAAASALAAETGALDRQRAALASAQRRLADAADEWAAATARHQEAAGEGDADAAAAYERAQRVATDREQDLLAARERLHAAERAEEALAAQAEVLDRAMDAGGGGAELVAAGIPGVGRHVSESIRVRAGYEAAIAAALGTIGDGVVAESRAAASAAAQFVRDHDLGGVDIVLAGPGPDAGPDAAAAPDGAVPASRLVDAPAGVVALLARILVVRDLDAAESAVAASAPDVIAVTLRGDVVGRFLLRPAGPARSRLELTAERDSALERRDQRARAAASLRVEVARLGAQLSADRDAARDAMNALRERDAATAVRAQDLTRATERHDAARAECERAEKALASASSAADAAAAAVAAADAAVREVASRPRPVIDAAARERLANALEEARLAEMQAMMRHEALRERAQGLRQRHDALRRQAEDDRAAAAAAQHREQERLARRARAAAVGARLPTLLASIDRSLAQARERWDELRQSRARAMAELTGLRRTEEDLRATLGEHTDDVHRIELALHERRLRLTDAVERARTELGLEPEVLLAEYGPEQAVPPDDPDGTPEPFDRARQQQRLAHADRALAQLGRVNPLALEEFAALEQRHAFLTEQLADLDAARGDLLRIVADLDREMAAIFTSAFEDTRAAFAEVFPLLFPGGTGSIALTDPDHPLDGGIEVSVRPAGKNVERLSLLSGGERSLAAVALLVAIFTARPSPFYILDEVEAALDDANLGRLLQVLERLRNSSQLIVITHQKRTMEIADALYGVSMRQDGVTAVVGQRMREAASR